MRHELKAYVIIYTKKETKRVVWTLEEAKQNMTEKQYMQLISWSGIHTAKYNGYVA